MIDIDFFKKVNDIHGHASGDITLKHLSSLLTTTIPDADLISRFGGEEFCVAWQGVSIDEARKYFESLRSTIANSSIALPNKTINVTVSIGLTKNKSKRIDTMIHLADEQLYLAKEGGRNRVCCDDCP